LKLTFINNACALYEHDGFRLLSDPWLVPGAFGTWVNDPPLKTRVEDLLGVDALYISHVHPDHLDPETLKHFPRETPIVTLREPLGLVPRKLAELGLHNVIALGDRETAILKHTMKAGQLEVTAFAPFTKHPFHADATEIGNVVDSALLIQGGGVKVLNSNDNTPSLEAAEWLRKEYGPFDVAQLNWNNAGPYPACFDNLTHEEKLSEANRCLDRNLQHMRAVALILDAKYTMPFAGQYKLGYGLEHLNQYLGTCSAANACFYLDGTLGVRALRLAEGESVDL
jgi:UDP-MurNAc hydroxylase